jgi:hypothetical protein
MRKAFRHAQTASNFKVPEGVTSNKLHTEEKQISAAIAQNLVARDLYTLWDKR